MPSLTDGPPEGFMTWFWMPEDMATCWDTYETLPYPSVSSVDLHTGLHAGSIFALVPTNGSWAIFLEQGDGKDPVPGILFRK